MAPPRPIESQMATKISSPAGPPAPGGWFFPLSPVAAFGLIVGPPPYSMQPCYILARLAGCQLVLPCRIVRASLCFSDTYLCQEESPCLRSLS